MGASAPDLLECALTDLDGDLGELSFLCASGQQRLAELEADLAEACPNPSTREVDAGGGVLAPPVSRARRPASRAARRSPIRPSLAVAGRSGQRRSAPLGRSHARRAGAAGRSRRRSGLAVTIVPARAGARGRPADRTDPGALEQLQARPARRRGGVRAPVRRGDDRRPGRRARAAHRLRDGRVRHDPGVAVRAREGSTETVLAGRGLYHESRLLLERMLPSGSGSSTSPTRRNCYGRSKCRILPRCSSTRCRTRPGCPSPTSAR